MSEETKAPVAEVTNPLLVESGGDGDETFEEGSFAPTEVETDEKGGKKVAFDTFKKRVGKLVSQRNQLREQHNATTRQLQEVKAQLANYEELGKIFTDKYAKNPEAAAHDISLLDALEEGVRAGDPEAKQAVEWLMAKRRAKGGTPKVETTQKQEARPEQAAPAKDTAAEKVIRQGAKAMIEKALRENDVSDNYVGLLTNAALAAHNVEQLAELDADAIVEFAKAHCKRSGVKIKDILKSKPAAEEDKEGEGDKPKPKSGGGQGKPAQSKGDESELDSDGQPKKQFKSVQEYEQHRRGKLRGLAAEMGLASR
jgi:hypothetical protein